MRWPGSTWAVSCLPGWSTWRCRGPTGTPCCGGPAPTWSTCTTIRSAAWWLSAFVTDDNWYAWPLLIALALFGANRVLGNWRTAVVCATGHVLGTLVSEGIVAYRVQHGLLPASGNRILDVGPSYVVVAAIMVALLYGSRRARVAAAADLAILVFIGQIFAGLSTLQVAAVGHATALVVGAAGGGLLLWQRRGTPADPASRPAAARLAEQLPQP